MNTSLIVTIVEALARSVPEAIAFIERMSNRGVIREDVAKDAMHQVLNHRFDPAYKQFEANVAAAKERRAGVE